MVKEETERKGEKKKNEEKKKTRQKEIDEEILHQGRPPFHYMPPESVKKRLKKI